MPDSDSFRGRTRDELIGEVRRRAARRRLYRRGGVAVAALAVCAAVAIPLALANGGGTQSVTVIAPPTTPTSETPAPTTTTTTSTEPPRTTTSVAPTTTSTTTTTRPATVVMTNNPWGSSGTLKSYVTVSSTVSGTCSAGDGRAYDCSSSSGTHYQCWASTAQPPSQVACGVKYTTQVVLMNLTAPLPAPGLYMSTEDLIAVILANGDQCEELWGTAAGLVDGVSMNYGCTSPSGSEFYAGGLDMSAPAWTLKIGPSCQGGGAPCTGPLVTEEVSRAWH